MKKSIFTLLLAAITLGSFAMMPARQDTTMHNQQKKSRPKSATKKKTMKKTTTTRDTSSGMGTGTTMRPDSVR